MDIDQIQLIFQLVLAVVLGGVIGLEREIKNKPAGFQTYSLVTLGATIFTISCSAIFNSFFSSTGISFDPSRVVLAVATGIGFIGAGVIFHRGHEYEGITTAAGLWCVAGIGVAIGSSLYLLAIASSVLVMIVFMIFDKIERSQLVSSRIKKAKR
jgi:putative Mg2+ transporter-C (MgtC) family protein